MVVTQELDVPELSGVSGSGRGLVGLSKVLVHQ